MKKAFVITGSILIVGIAVAVVAFQRRPKEAYEYIVAQKGDIAQEVSVTGRVLPIESVELAFEISGKITQASSLIGEGAIVFLVQFLILETIILNIQAFQLLRRGQ